MKNLIPRRTMLKSMGLLSLGGLLGKFDAIAAQKEKKQPDFSSQSEIDVLVIGGGTAGVVAAIQAARAGSRTMLIEQGSLLGGTMTSGGVAIPGLFHAWGKQIIAGIGWELVADTVALNGDRLPDFTKPFGKDHSKHQVILNSSLYALLAEERCLQAGVDVHYYETPQQIDRKDGLWHVEVAAKDTHRTITCKQLVDCTGNAAIVALAGYKRLREEESQPGSLIFELSGYNYDMLDREALNRLYEKALKEGIILKTDAYNGIMPLLAAKNGLATQHVLRADSSTSAAHTAANVAGRASLLRILRFVQTLPGCENTRIEKMYPETAVRETYRIDGICQITAQDYTEGRLFADALAYAYYPIDMHVSEGVAPQHLSEGKVATIPYRALIPKQSENILVAGRCISSDRMANSALRVQASCMAMGQISGAAAALACQLNCTPEKVPLDRLKSTLRAHGGIVPKG